MLPRSARLTSPDDFARTTKSGFRVTSKSLVGYLYLSLTVEPAKCGLIISKSVGGSVVRHRRARQIRHAIAPQLHLLPQGGLLVLRALPGSSALDIPGELSRLIPKLLQKSAVAG